MVADGRQEHVPVTAALSDWKVAFKYGRAHALIWLVSMLQNTLHFLLQETVVFCQWQASKEA